MMARGGKWAICSQNAFMPHMGHDVYARFYRIIVIIMFIISIIMYFI
jgi:hypothetical protein